MRGVAKFKLGGTEHTVSVSLAVAETVEAATDKGVMRLMRDVLTREAKLTDVVTVIAAALNAASKTREYGRDDVAGMIATDGMLNGFIAAGKILGALFDAPEAAKSTKGKAEAVPN
jgi:hypothetical protein